MHAVFLLADTVFLSGGGIGGHCWILFENVYTYIHIYLILIGRIICICDIMCDIFVDYKLCYKIVKSSNLTCEY